VKNKKCLVPDKTIIVQSHYVNFNKSVISVTVKNDFGQSCLYVSASYIRDPDT